LREGKRKWKELEMKRNSRGRKRKGCKGRRETGNGNYGGVCVIGFRGIDIPHVNRYN